ncbi:MAG: CPBP family intramembrane metalloprotease [Treponema sp.]|jgi:membrane protease YdiL (CAAX protease family)|nr:CPBP family intramembrane metalloprotease [Treponema sp.]
MGVYLEAIILYVVVFLSGSASFLINGPPAGAEVQAGFPVTATLAGIMLRSIPSLALIWFLLLKNKKLKDWGIKPGIKDLVSCIYTLPCLLIIGFTVTFVSSKVGEASLQITLVSPSNAFEWIILCLSCILAAYLEESFFRFYLLSRRNEFKLSAVWALSLSVTLFSICHIYEGPWGFLNAVLSSILLCFMFLRYKSIHGISIAHAMYNIAVYVINAMVMG